VPAQGRTKVSKADASNDVVVQINLGWGYGLPSNEGRYFHRSVVADAAARKIQAHAGCTRAGEYIKYITKLQAIGQRLLQIHTWHFQSSANDARTLLEQCIPERINNFVELHRHMLLFPLPIGIHGNCNGYGCGDIEAKKGGRNNGFARCASKRSDLHPKWKKGYGFCWHLSQKGYGFG